MPWHIARFCNGAYRWHTIHAYVSLSFMLIPCCVVHVVCLMSHAGRLLTCRAENSVTFACCLCERRFYDKAHKLDILEFFKGQAVDPDSLPDAVFAAIGRTVWHDIGLTAYAFRLMMKVMDYNLMAIIIARLAPLMPDFRRFQKERAPKAKAR